MSGGHVELPAPRLLLDPGSSPAPLCELHGDASGTAAVAESRNTSRQIFAPKGLLSKQDLTSLQSRISALCMRRDRDSGFQMAGVGARSSLPHPQCSGLPHTQESVSHLPLGETRGLFKSNPEYALRKA